MALSLRARELYILYIVLFFTMAGFGIIFPVLPLVVLELDASSLHMGLLVTLYALCQFLFAPFWGALSDRYGRKVVMIIGLFGFSISFFLMGLATNIWALIGARVLGGLLSAATLPTAQAYAADSSSLEERGPAMARLGAAMGAGFMIGPALGGALSVFGLRAAFFVTAALSLLTAVLALIAMTEPPRRTVQGGRRLSSIAALRYASGSSHAILFWLAFIITFCQSELFSMMGLYLAERFGGGGVLTGAAFTVNGLAATLVQGLIVGWSMRQYGEERTILAGLVVGAVSFAALGLAPHVGLALVAVIGTSAALSLVRPTIASSVSRRATFGQGMTMGIQAAFDSLGRVVGPLVAGAIYTWRPEVPFFVASVIYLAAFLIARRQLPKLATVPSEPAVAPEPTESGQAPGQGKRAGATASGACVPARSHR
ncbi:MAG TPA: MFS transporter [Bacillota bacterium]